MTEGPQSVNETQDTQPAYDVYIEQDRLTFVRRPEQAVDSTPAQEPFLWVLIVMLSSHGLIALLTLTLAAYLTLTPDTAQVYALVDRLPSIAQVYALPAITMSQSLTVPTTGHVHVPAIQARGLVIFYNALTRAQVIEAGTLLVSTDGEQIVTDQAAYVPAGNYASNGQTSVWAHALNPGAEGNIRAGDIQGPCCRAFVQAVNEQFAGGHGARDMKIVTQADISLAATAVLTQLQHSIQERMASLSLPPGEVVLLPVPCITHTVSNHAVGAEAARVMVKVRQTCQPSAYNTHDLQRTLASLIAGKTPGQARAILARQGIKDAGFRLAWLRDRLPVDPGQIHMILLFH